MPRPSSFRIVVLADGFEIKAGKKRAFIRQVANRNEARTGGSNNVGWFRVLTTNIGGMGLEYNTLGGLLADAAKGQAQHPAFTVSKGVR